MGGGDDEKSTVGGGEGRVGDVAAEVKLHAGQRVGGVKVTGGASVDEREFAFGETIVAKLPCDLSGGTDSDAAVGVGEVLIDLHAFSGGHDVLCRFALLHPEGGHIDARLRLVVAVLAVLAGGSDEATEVEHGGFSSDSRFDFEEVAVANDLVEGSNSGGGHEFAHFLGDEGEEAGDVGGFSAEAGDEFGILGGDSGGASEAALAVGVGWVNAAEVALSQHGTADGDQEGSAEADFVGSEKEEFEDLLAVLDAAIDGDFDEVAGAFFDEHLLDGREDGSGGESSVLLVDALCGTCSAASVADVDTVGTSVDAANDDHFDSGGGDEFEGAVDARIKVSPTFDHQLDVFDRIEVVVDGRADELVAGLATPPKGDHRGDFFAGELSAFAGLGALGEFDLCFICAGGGEGGDGEPSSCVLDGAVAVGAAHARLFETAFAGVGDGSDAGKGAFEAGVAVENVEGSCDGAVGGFAEGSFAHAGSHEPPDD